MNTPTNDVTPQGYKMTKLGALPEEWEVVKLIEHCDLCRGTEPGSDSYNRVGNGVPFIRVGNIAAQTQELVYTSSDNIKRCNKEDVLVSFDGSPGVVVKGFEGAYSSGIRKVILKTDFIYNYFVYYVLQTKYVQKVIEKYATGVTIKHASKSIQHILIPLPPFLEQQKIAAVLSAVQEAKEKTEAVIAAAKALKKSMMKHLFTYGPVSPQEAKNVPLKETEIGSVPEEWDVVKLKDIAEFKNGINFTAGQKGEKGILTIDVLNMYGESIYVNLNNLYRVDKKIDENYLLKEGDILFVRSSLKREGVGWTSLFKPAGEPVTFCGFIIRARLKAENIFPEYLTNYLRTETARNNLIASSGKVAITNINQGMLGKVSVPVPSLPIQQKIAEILTSVDRKIDVEENKKKALEDLFKTLLHNLMTAKIRVNQLEISS